ncbi:NnrS family protein [uncultured Shimia sp.]|uniref:NnrS family protein n=1 Tax=uncultured Shimia sp. TaxID=573152 RepID=UPI0026353BBD|nr:NnrS family protein [uncultured Shimia sp.]
MTVLKRVFGEGFRIFFLSAGIYGVLTGSVWALWLMAQDGSGWDPLVAANPQMWHAHEMIFGYATAALGGFFLTAVPNWTNTPAARINYLTLAALLWLIGRVAMWFSGLIPAGALAVCDLAFVPVLGVKIASQLVKRPKPQNMMFLAILLLLWASNLMVHLDRMGAIEDGESAGLRGGLFSLCAMIAILGGRITPAFTRNAMKREGEPENRWPMSYKPVERATVVLALALPALVIAQTPEALPAVVAIGLGLLQGARLLSWRGAWTLRQPILFALHLGLGMLGLGLCLWGLAGLGLGDEVAALHLVGIGGVGGMTLAVMSRASLGHSGRPLTAPRPVALAYGLLALTAILRWWGAGLEGDSYLPVMALVSILWSLTFLLYLVALWPTWLLPKQRGET